MNSDNQLQDHRHDKDDALKIVKVAGRRAINEFIRLPWPLYIDDPMWVPPLLLERRMHLSPKNPYFEHAKFCSWIIYRGSNPVGRISAQIDRLHIDRHQDSTGFFGMLEAEDNSLTFRALLETAESWLRDQGMRRICGPYNLSINQELGLLVDGFDSPPSLMMGHARPYYAPRIEENGYQKEKDLLAYIINTNSELSDTVVKITARVKDRVHVRKLRKSQFAEELNIIRDIFNDAWSQNWGFVPFTNKEFEHLGKDLKMLADEELVKIAEVDGNPEAFIVLLPNINEIIRDLNGRLLPFGWLKILWRLKVKYPATARIPLMGVRCRYHGSLLGAALAFMVIADLKQPALKRGLKEVELSWVLEDNKGMRGIIESIGGRDYKTYRIYSKELTGDK
ncbi:MAG: N-acetyltransferase [Deltaproteobacteria bacterium]|nr:N-acetyltransferase [Deltaproteobacteria bacterium]